MKIFVFFAILLTVLSSCEAKADEIIIAEVYNERLYAHELADEMKSKGVTKDSAAFKEVYVNKWINEQIIIHHAKSEQLIDQKAINRKVENYKNQLLVHYFQNEAIKKQIDTVVTQEEIKAYYQKHKPDFQLKDYLVKVLYLKLSEDAPDLDKVGKWYRLKDKQDETDIIQYASMYATNFYFDQTNWIYFDEITKEIPLSDINKDRFITKKSEIKFSENNFIYYLNILDYKLKDAVSPIEFEKDNIKERILNTRVLALRKKINKDLIQKAENENAIKKY